MRTNVEIKEEAVREIMATLVSVSKNPLIWQYSIVMREIEDAFLIGKDHYEIEGFYTKTGNPYIIDLEEKDFYFEEEEGELY